MRWSISSRSCWAGGQEKQVVWEGKFTRTNLSDQPGNSSVQYQRLSRSDISTLPLIQVPRIKGPVGMTNTAMSRIWNVSVIESAIGFFLFPCQDTDGYFAIRGVNNPEIYLQKALDYDKFNSTTLLLFARVSGLGRTECLVCLVPLIWRVSLDGRSLG